MQKLLLGGLIGLFAALPATTNYQLNSFSFGSGGTANSSTATYSLEGTAGELGGGGQTATVNGTAKPGYIQTQQANVPTIAVDNNTGIYYNKLHFVIGGQNNPSDAKYLIAVTTASTTNMNTAGGLQYVQPDGTLSSSLSLSDYQTLAGWGGAGGSLIIGLVPGTTYYVAVRAAQGKFSESAYGPVAAQATASPTISFALQTSSGPTPPYTVNIGTLSAGTVDTAAQTVNTSLSTNAASGADVYITGLNGGLKSASQSFLIGSATSDLSSASNGFGGQNSSATQASGGPLTVVGPYNGSGNTVGVINGTTRSLYSSSGPVFGGSGVLSLKAKAAATDVAAADYQETLTFTAAANY